MGTINQDSWKAGNRHGRTSLVVNLLTRECSDKFDLIKELFQRTSASPDPETKGYAEGMRHALNILQSCTSAHEAFNAILNKSVNPLAPIEKAPEKDIHTNTKARWVVNRLKRQGFNTNFNHYSNLEILVWKSLGITQTFDWTNTLLFYVNLDKGCRIEFRPAAKQQLHMHWHLSWPTVKNWGEIAECEAYCRQTMEAFGKR